jgi:hypothetical protein
MTIDTEGMAGMTDTEEAGMATSATLTGMITMYGVPEVGDTYGIGADWDGGG